MLDEKGPACKGIVINVVAPVGAAMENRTMATLVLVLDRLLFTAVSVLGEDSVPLALTFMEPLKEDRRLRETVIPPEMRDT